ncbi:helix-turn-helix domain-containing protein [Acidianus sp. HS-5]|uniref:helix-turn-helix domain-containing protein n=1 Tax=Acidianus sp. HS-5 TaxID=2886040 RepID=UPI001F3D8753|nr:helix-turn-helix domain-containing protein [Acidianus sp. HS-5]BDC19471.1 bacterio-opsin activator [Acidianus sp. HS-5]
MLYVSFKVNHEEWSKGIDYSRNSLSVLDIKPSIGGARLLIEFKGKEEESRKLKWNLSRVSKFKYLGTIIVNDEIELILSNYIIMNGTATSDGMYWTVILSDYAELKKMLREFLEHHIEVKVVKVIKVKSEDTLTARQEQILKIAFEAGYFDYPKKIRIKELAEKLNMSISNLSEILRRAEKNVIETFFRERS